MRNIEGSIQSVTLEIKGKREGIFHHILFYHYESYVIPGQREYLNVYSFEILKYKMFSSY